MKLKRERRCGRTGVSHQATRNAIAGAAMLACWATLVGAAPGPYQIKPLGLFNSDYVSPNGTVDSRVVSANRNGRATGYSLVYHGYTDPIGQTSWLYDGTQIVPMPGLTGGQYAFEGHQPKVICDSGQVLGESTWYSNFNLNYSHGLWLYDSGVTTRLGLFDAEHTASGGVQNSGGALINAIGQVTGYSVRYDGTSVDTGGLGLTAWLYSGGTTTRIGLLGGEYIGTTGAQMSRPDLLNGNGDVAGIAYRYSNTEFEQGISTWFYSGGQTTPIGFRDAEHTSSTGWQQSRVYFLNEAGQVVGDSERYNASGDNGNTLWLYDHGTYHQLGFTTGDYLDASGRRFSLVEQLSNGGQVSGVSANYRFPGSYSAWLYDNGSTARVGLVDAQHTSPNGRQESHVRLLNNSGRAAGYSYSYLGETPTNRTAWVYDGHVSKRIGLIDDSQSSDVQFLNEAGQVVGYSDFYASGCNLRHAAWFYDPSLDESIPLVFWTGTDGYVSTDPWYLGEDGTVVGSYAKGTLQNHVHLAFFWSREEGFYSLGELVDGGLSQSGWDLLRVADRIDRLGQIGGVGYLTGRSGLVPYVMTPIPEPADIGWSIALPFALGCRRHARRRGRTLKTCPHT